MAQGRAGAGWLVAVAVALTVLVSTGVWNPFPDLWTWINTSGPVADPMPRWQERLGGTPQTLTLTDDFVVVEHRDSVEALNRFTGRRNFSTEADWSAVAGPADKPVIVAGKLLVKGYQVLDPRSGTVVWRDGEASAVWTYRDEIVDVACRTPKDCEVSGRAPATGNKIWSTGLPGMGFVLFADNPELLGTRPIESDRIADRHEPGTRPELLAFPIDGKVYVVDPRRSEARLDPALEPGRRDRITVAGGRIVRSTATPRDGGCDVAVTALDAVSRQRVWHLPAGQHLRTFDGGGCDQRRLPAGTDSVLVGLTIDGREQLIEAGFGEQVLLCAAGEHILGVTGGLALVRSADGRRLSAVVPDGRNPAKPKALWHRKISPEASAALRGTVVVVSDRGPNRVIALNPEDGKVRKEVKSDAEVLAADDKGLLLGQRRDLGYLPFD
ncbi:outer membrane protein assembly factor BamB family protein [Catellatospora citrea]|uniref:outer membrane protein assembly factor BamB family protein n=1 Tax=Catellatospora citrea TaxID=53366 RepID=UPI000E70C06D|nr:PQQ-binding-like beta-propeller repeat protein [Catellatospora citrea]